MTKKKDFFISYTQADRAWAVWIAWQLEAANYTTILQAWDFVPGSNWVHKMDDALENAERIVAVLSPAYLQSHQGAAEWYVAQADDPRGEQRKLIPVLVGNVELAGLFKTRVHIDLVGKNKASAQSELLGGVSGERGKPTVEPDFPGAHLPTATEEPPFPGKDPPEFSEELKRDIRAGDAAAFRDLRIRVASSLREQGFSDSDIQAFEVSLRELVDNVVNHVGNDAKVYLQLNKFDRHHGHRLEGLALLVTDGGEGFDFESTLVGLEAELSEYGKEHGLLRAYRLGSELTQVTTNPHAMGWMREQMPQDVPSTFERVGREDVVPFVFSYKDEAIRISREVHSFYQFEQYLKRSPAFLDLIFDPLLRPARKYVGIEVVEHGWTGALYWKSVLDQLLAFASRNEGFDKQLLLFANTSPSEQRLLRKYCIEHPIKMYEDESLISKE